MGFYFVEEFPAGWQKYRRQRYLQAVADKERMQARNQSIFCTYQARQPKQAEGINAQIAKDHS